MVRQAAGPPTAAKSCVTAICCLPLPLCLNFAVDLLTLQGRTRCLLLSPPLSTAFSMLHPCYATSWRVTGHISFHQQVRRPFVCRLVALRPLLAPPPMWRMWHAGFWIGLRPVLWSWALYVGSEPVIWGEKSLAHMYCRLTGCGPNRPQSSGSPIISGSRKFHSLLNISSPHICASTTRCLGCPTAWHQAVTTLPAPALQVLNTLPTILFYATTQTAISSSPYSSIQRKTTPIGRPHCDHQVRPDALFGAPHAFWRSPHGLQPSRSSGACGILPPEVTLLSGCTLTLRVCARRNATPRSCPPSGACKGLPGAPPRIGRRGNTLRLWAAASCAARLPHGGV